MTATAISAESCATGIPNPIVKLNRSVLLLGSAIALVSGTPLITTAMFVVVALAAIFGRRGSLIFALGSRLFPGANERALATGHFEDRRLMRFNNALAAIMLGLAQFSFLLGWPVLGWSFTIMVAIAAGVALAGFCIGCLIFTQWHIRTTLRRQSKQQAEAAG